MNHHVPDIDASPEQHPAAQAGCARPRENPTQEGKGLFIQLPKGKSS